MSAANSPSATPCSMGNSEAAGCTPTGQPAGTGGRSAVTPKEAALEAVPDREDVAETLGEWVDRMVWSFHKTIAKAAPRETTSRADVSPGNGGRGRTTRHATAARLPVS